jgi:hypothetical protein
MFYRWTKFFAAHSILKVLIKRTSVIEGNEIEPKFIQSYGWVDLQDIQHRKSQYSIVTLLEVAKMLNSRNEVTIRHNPTHEFNIGLKIEPNGITALKEWSYIWKVLKEGGAITGGIIVVVAQIIQTIKRV